MLRIRRSPLNLLKPIQNLNKNVVDTGINVFSKFEAKIKGTFLERWVNYWKPICSDYKEAALEVVTDIKQRPLKATTYATILGSIYYCAVHNPDERSHRDAYLKATNEMLLVHPSSQKKECVDYLKAVEINYNRQHLRRLNLLVASIIWSDYYSETCNVYEAQCSYLKLQYHKIFNKIVDVGFLDKWWILSDKMVDYDINY